jgi:hypothetical protein
MDRSIYQIPSDHPLSNQQSPRSSVYPATPPTGATFVNGGPHSASLQPLTYAQTPGSATFPATPHKPEDSSSYFKQQQQYQVQVHPDDVILAQPEGNGLFRARTERIKAAGRRGWAALMASFGRKWDRAVNARAMWPRITYSIVGLLLCGVWFGVT